MALAIQFEFGRSQTWEEAPLDPDWILAGLPQTQINPLAARGRLSSGFWQCTEGHFNWHYQVDEMIHILEGDALIRDRATPLWCHLRAGDSVLFPKGSSAEWIVERYVRKFYVIVDRRSLLKRIYQRFTAGKRDE